MYYIVREKGPGTFDDLLSEIYYARNVIYSYVDSVDDPSMCVYKHLGRAKLIAINLIVSDEKCRIKIKSTADDNVWLLFQNRWWKQERGVDKQ